MWWEALASVIVEKLYSLLESKAFQFYGFEDQFQELKDELCCTLAFLEDAKNVKPEQHNKTLKAITAQLRELAYDAEEIIEDHELHLHKAPSSKIAELSARPFDETGKHLEKITHGMKKVRKRMAGCLVPALGLTSHNEGAVHVPLRYPMLLDRDEMVGLDIHSLKVKQWILDRNEPMTMIGIVGMGGIGKTTLAQKIFHDAQDYFGIKLFVTVSRSFKFEELLKTILVKLNVDVEEEYLRGDVRDLLKVLRINLYREYLLVLDDVWCAEEGLWWESLKSGLPKVHWSCVIVTTRKEEVAKSMGVAEEHIHRPNLLSEDESWSLFSKVAFQRSGGRCPDPTLGEIGKKIVSKCGRLPLAIKITGGMMVAKRDSIHKWQQTLEQLEKGSASSRKDGMLIPTVELSYEDLPSHLKPCVLCFAMLPEDYVCRMSDMVNWWIGEGFVWGRDGRTTLEIGEEYFMELLNRSLIIGEKKDDFGEKYISCRMHDIVHEMTRKIAQEENFLGFRHGNRNMSVIPYRNFPIEDKLTKLWTLAVEGDDWKGLKSSLEKASCRLRVLFLCLKTPTFNGRNWHEEGTGRLHHLKYLNLFHNGSWELPDSFAELPNLQVLVVRSVSLKKLPPSIASLEKLIVLDVENAPYLERMPDGLGNLSNLEKLWGYKLPEGRLEEGSCWAVELKKLTKLRTFSIMVEDEMEQGAWKVLAALPQLKVLEVRFKFCESVLESDHQQQLDPLGHLEELRILHYPTKSVPPAWLQPAAFPKLRLLTFKIGQVEADASDCIWPLYPTVAPQRLVLSSIAKRIPYAQVFLNMPPYRKPQHFSPTLGIW